MEAPHVSIRLPRALIDGLERARLAQRRTRSNLIALYVERGLAADGVPVDVPKVSRAGEADGR